MASENSLNNGHAVEQDEASCLKRVLVHFESGQDEGEHRQKGDR